MPYRLKYHEMLHSEPSAKISDHAARASPNNECVKRRIENEKQKYEQQNLNRNRYPKRLDKRFLAVRFENHVAVMTGEFRVHSPKGDGAVTNRTCKNGFNHDLVTSWIIF